MIENKYNLIDDTIPYGYVPLRHLLSYARGTTKTIIEDILATQNKHSSFEIWFEKIQLQPGERRIRYFTEPEMLLIVQSDEIYAAALDAKGAQYLCYWRESRYFSTTLRTYLTINQTNTPASMSMLWIRSKKTMTDEIRSGKLLTTNGYTDSVVKKGLRMLKQAIKKH